MKETKDKTGFALAGAVVAAVTASLCCILPILAAIVGVSGFAASAFFEHWRPYLLAGTFGLLAVGFYFAYWQPRREVCEAGSVCERTPIGRWNRAILWLATGFVIVFAAFPYYAGALARVVTRTRPSAVVASRGSVAHAVLKIDGMVCTSCAALLEKRLSQVPGVHRAEVSFEKKQATVDYDAGTVDPSGFAKVVAEAGYKAIGRPQASN